MNSSGAQDSNVGENHTEHTSGSPADILAWGWALIWPAAQSVPKPAIVSNFP